jgi:hypothetical protein
VRPPECRRHARRTENSQECRGVCGRKTGSTPARARSYGPARSSEKCALSFAAAEWRCTLCQHDFRPRGSRQFVVSAPSATCLPAVRVHCVLNQRARFWIALEQSAAPAWRRRVGWGPGNSLPGAGRRVPPRQTKAKSGGRRIATVDLGFRGARPRAHTLRLLAGARSLADLRREYPSVFARTTGQVLKFSFQRRSEGPTASERLKGADRGAQTISRR